jgi:hypothetical protein
VAVWDKRVATPPVRLATATLIFIVALHFRDSKDGSVFLEYELLE